MTLPRSSTSPWIRVDIEHWNSLTAGRTPVLYRKKSPVFHQEEPSACVHIVRSGRVRITSYQRDGAEKQFYIAERGCLFGENSGILGTAHTTSAVAIVDSEVYCIPFGEFETAMREDWGLTRRVLQMLCRKNNALSRQVLDLSFSQAIQRVSQVLLNIGDEYGEEAAQGIRISIRFTHQDISNITNVSRVTVSNIFNMLAGKGILAREAGYFILLQPGQLEEYAGGRKED